MPSVSASASMNSSTSPKSTSAVPPSATTDANPMPAVRAKSSSAPQTAPDWEIKLSRPGAAATAL